MKQVTAAFSRFSAVLAVTCWAVFSDARLSGGASSPGGASLAAGEVHLAARGGATGASAPQLFRSDARLNTSEAPGLEMDTRPNEGGAPDVVEFGILVKGIKGITMSKGSYRADVVLTLRWTDPRTKSLVPAGVRKHTIKADIAKNEMWMPDVAVTNRKIGGQEVISSGTTVTLDGKVTKTERLIIVCTNKFQISSFPFDSQVLKLRVASTTMMLDEVKLTPIQDKLFMGIKDGVFAGTDLFTTGVEAQTVDEVDGALRKSRGELLIKVKRNAQVYLRKKLVPELFLVMISWTVFYFPLKPPFAMPRVATSLISYLSFTALAGKTSPGLGQTWLDVFEESVIISLFLTVFLNIFVEIVENSLERPRIASRIDYELKFFLPFLAIITFTILFCCIHAPIIVTSVLTRIVSLFGPIIYFAISLKRFPDIGNAFQEYHVKHTKEAVDSDESDAEFK